MGPDLSIIIPVYNVEKYLSQCIDSIIRQDDVDFEIIAVDDGSPDNSGRVLDDYAKRDKRIHVIHQKNAGVSRARNTGLKEASGKWIYFVDSDDWLIDGQLKLLVLHAEKSDADVVFVDCIERFENGRSNRIHLFSRKFSSDDKALIQKIQNSILCHKYNPYFVPGADSAYPAPWSKLIKTELIHKNEILFDPYVEGVYDDGLFTLEVLQRAKKIAYFGKSVYNYRILSSSIVHSYRKGLVEKFEKNCERIDDFTERYGKDSAFINAEYCRRVAYLSSFLSAYFFSENNPMSDKEKNRELLETLDRNPWRVAIDTANIDFLEFKHRMTCLCMRKRFLPGLRLYALMKKKKIQSMK